MKSKCFVLFALIAVLLMACPATAATIALWDFEDGVDGDPFSPGGGGSGGSADLITGTLMRGWDSYWGPGWTSSNLAALGLSMNNADNHQDGYVTEGPLFGWSPSAWTVEATVYLEEISGWETMVGRDGSTEAGAGSDFYLSNNGIDDKFRIDIDTVGGQRWIVDGDYAVQTNKWYALAAMSDGATLSLWLDDGAGYQQIGSLDISAQSVADNALPGSSFNWTFGRGWYGGSFVDHIDGKMDNIRFSDEALGPEQLIPLVPEPTTVVLLLLGAAALGVWRRR